MPLPATQMLIEKRNFGEVSAQRCGCSISRGKIPQKQQKSRPKMQKTTKTCPERTCPEHRRGSRRIHLFCPPLPALDSDRGSPRKRGSTPNFLASQFPFLLSTFSFQKFLSLRVVPSIAPFQRLPLSARSGVHTLTIIYAVSGSPNVDYFFHLSLPFSPFAL